LWVADEVAQLPNPLALFIDDRGKGGRKKKSESNNIVNQAITRKIREEVEEEEIKEE
jgi:hypothetical protein